MAKKQTRQTRSEVTFLAPEPTGVPLGSAKWTFRASYNRKRVGELVMTRGSVIWIGAYKQPTKFNWRDFAEFMQEHGGKNAKAAKKKTKKKRAKKKRTASHW